MRGWHIFFGGRRHIRFKLQFLSAGSVLGEGGYCMPDMRFGFLFPRGRISVHSMPLRVFRRSESDLPVHFLRGWDLLHWGYKRVPGVFHRLFFSRGRVYLHHLSCWGIQPEKRMGKLQSVRTRAVLYRRYSGVPGLFLRHLCKR